MPKKYIVIAQPFSIGGTFPVTRGDLAVLKCNDRPQVSRLERGVSSRLQAHGCKVCFIFPSNPGSPSENGEPTNLSEILVPKSSDNVIGLGFAHFGCVLFQRIFSEINPG